jgi:hypothetical protein
MQRIAVLSLVIMCLSIVGYFVGFYFGQESVASIADETRWECFKGEDNGCN